MVEEHKVEFYIAHKITTRQYIRDDICPFLHEHGIGTINPFYNQDGTTRKERPEIKAIDEGKMGEYDITRKVQSKDIVEKDLKKIRESNGIIAFIEESSIGTAMEIFYCARWCKKPVFIVTTSYTGHPWLIYLTNMNGGKITNNKNELVRAIKKWMKKNEVG